jgi:hypothetical protein
MSTTTASEGRALYRFDPHDEGIWLGLGLVRLSMVCGSMLLGALMVYTGSVLLALVLLLIVPPLVLARWEGLPLLAWLPLKALYRLQGPREWALDPEHVGFVTPLTTVVPPVATGAAPVLEDDEPGVHDEDEDLDELGDVDEDLEVDDDLPHLNAHPGDHDTDSDGDLLW